MKAVSILFVALALMGCGDAVVDGACASGFEYRSFACRPVAAPAPTAADDAGSFDSGRDPEASACAADVMVDPYNCGVCGNVCTTGICNGGLCYGAVPGHVVVLGHDYSGTAPGLAISRVLANATFLAQRNPIRVVAFQQWADPTSVASVQATLDHAASTSGRSYLKTVAGTGSQLRASLRIEDFDVALIVDQPNAPAGALEALGNDARASLDSFARVGGVVVVLDGGSGVSEMPRFLTASGLLSVASHTNTSSSRVNVVAPADAIGIGVHSPYSAAFRSVTFTLAEASAPSVITVVSEPESHNPVVLHKVVFQ